MHPFMSPKCLIGAAAIACAAALIPGGRAGRHRGTRRGQDAELRDIRARGWMNTQGDASMSHTGYTLNFTNLSGHACTLRGSPGVSAVSLGGRQIGRAANGNYFGKTRAVKLAGGATATAQLDISMVGAFSRSARHQVTAAGLRVYPPGQFASKVIPFPFGACSSRTGWVYMSVGTLQKS